MNLDELKEQCLSYKEWQGSNPDAYGSWDSQVADAALVALAEIERLSRDLADTQVRLIVSEKRLKWTQQISDGRRALMVCYRLGTQKGADAALTHIEKAEVALAALGGKKNV